MTDTFYPAPNQSVFVFSLRAKGTTVTLSVNGSQQIPYRDFDVVQAGGGIVAARWKSSDFSLAPTDVVQANYTAAG